MEVNWLENRRVKHCSMRRKAVTARGFGSGTTVGEGREAGKSQKKY
jgi:FAD/FMN-containing dehydrogenase